MANKCIDWLKVGAYDRQWPTTIIEEREEPQQGNELEEPPLSRSLRVQWVLVVSTWIVLCVGLAIRQALRG